MQLLARDIDELMTRNSTEGKEKQRVLLQDLWEAKWHPTVTVTPHSADSEENYQSQTENIRRCILSSLSFETIQDRENMIEDAYTETFEWIFCTDEERNMTMQYDPISTWLESQHDSIYWITGKPGSGKSTLMRHITTHPSLGSYLGVWAGNLPVLSAACYFWDAGSALHKSKEGLLRTLLLECFESRPDLVPKVCARRWMLARALPDVEPQFPEWELTELEESFRCLLSLSGKLFRLALFIDGLDEFNGGHRDLVWWIRDINENYDVKICVASRNWPEFSDFLSQGPCLKMEELTKSDIKRFVSGRFVDCGGFRDLQPIYPLDCQSLQDDIVDKTQGVFLGVHLVVKNLITFLNKRKLGNIKELQKMVNCYNINMVIL